MNKASIIIVGTSLLVTFVAAGESPIDWYDCTGKENGNYAHPVDCTRFVSCSNKIAYEQDCAVCEYDPVRCPEGRLIFDIDTNQCLYANEARCSSLCDELGGGKRGGRRSRIRGGKLF